ncbi:MAG: symmetrical bis(5-nucleosyl)-tetraphosphatase [Nevskia sp.]|nr:symmetrical bis(5-nucleosyl)-tetraphosphatase [Nevskia sp.]
MATYAIGDLQGCLTPLKHLLEKLRFDPVQDQLWFAGDLVNRGPESAATLRFVRALGSSASVVLGNHDLHLLAVANGRRSGRRDTLDDILHAPDRDELLDWLRQQPLLVEDAEHGIAMLHAGLPPQWTLAQARSCAREAEAALRGTDYLELLRQMYGDEPSLWDDALSGYQRLRFIVNCFTRLRYCDASGRIAPEPKGAPGEQTAGLMPWFMAPQRKSSDYTIVFGHWSTLGKVAWPEHHVYGLDTGCVWGGQLTALRLDDGAIESVSCAGCGVPIQHP